MTVTERLYRLALASYPKTKKAECGDEIVATALELSNDRFSLREAVGLVVGGMRSRSRAATGTSLSGLVQSALRLGIFLWVLDPVIALIFLDYEAAMPWYFVVLGAAFPAALLLSTRPWVAMLWTLASGWALFDNASNLGWHPAVFLWSAPTLIALWYLALRTDGRRAMPVWGAAALAGLMALTYLISPSWVYGFVPHYDFGQTTFLVVLGALGLAISRVDPRLLAGVWVSFGLQVLWHSTSGLVDFHVNMVPVWGAAMVASLIFAVGVRSGHRETRRL